MKVVAMVPIKLNNQRIPGKNLKKFDDGTPLLHFILRTLIKTKEIDEVYVYCSDESIKKNLIDGVKFLKRDNNLDLDNINCNDILESFMKEVDADVYVASHVTGPFTRSESVSECINKVLYEDYDSAFMAKRISEFLWMNGKPMNFDVDNFPRTQDLVPIYSETPGAYVFKKKVFETYRRRVGKKPYIHEVSEIESRDIDYPEDFKIANAIYMNILK